MLKLYIYLTISLHDPFDVIFILFKLRYIMFD